MEREPVGYVTEVLPLNMSSVRPEPLMHASRRAVVAASVIFGFGALFATASPVAAECTFFDAWPSFRSSVPTADRIVIGKVVTPYDEPDGARRTIRFAFRVDEVVRGSEGPVIEFRDGLYSGAPIRCRDSLLRPRVGDVLALAFDATLARYPDPVIGVALVNRKPNRWDRFTMPGVEGITRADVRALAAVPQGPTTDIEPPSATRTSTGPSFLIVFVGILGGLAFLRRMGFTMETDQRE